MGSFLSQLMGKLLGEDSKHPEGGGEIDGNICVCCGTFNVAEHVEHEKTVIKKGQTMTTKTLYIDSRTKIKGTHADFTISLPEQMTLRGARVRVDNIRTTDTFPTVTETNKFVYFLSPTGLTVVSLQLGAYTGSTFAAELAAKTGRTVCF